MDRATALRDFFLPFDLLGFEVLDAFFIGADDRGAVRLDDPVQQLLDAALNFPRLGFERLASLFLRAMQVVPVLLEHHASDLEEPFGWRERTQQLRELAFDGVTLDRLAVARAAALWAEVVRIARVPPGRPTGRQRRAAIPAHDGAAQWEVLADILAHRSVRLAVQPILNLAERLEADQPLVLALAQTDIPARRFDITGIDHAGQ